MATALYAKAHIDTNYTKTEYDNDVVELVATAAVGQDTLQEALSWLSMGWHRAARESVVVVASVVVVIGESVQGRSG